MKGTLFSADFIKDADANLRLLELNTDTGFIANTLSSRFDFTSFISILNSNSITELVLVYKSMQRGFVALLKDTIATDATFITTVTEQVEDANTIYPTAVTDSSEKFILRLAYDENALFDSTYCKDRANVQKLFYDNSATGSIPEFYYSGSEYVVNTLTSDVNDHTLLPDFVTKPKSEEHVPLSFYDIKGSDSSSEDRITNFVDEYVNLETHTIEKFHYNATDITDDGKISGYRIVGIVYGADIEYVNIGQWRVQSFFEIPTTAEIDYITAHSDSFATRYHDKHYYQFTSNWLRTTSGDGLLLGQSILNLDNTSGQIELLEANDVVKSIFINGLPDGDVQSMYDTWSSSGISFPSGSYVTSSVVESITELDTNKSYGILGELKVSETDAIYSTTGKHYLVYSTGSNEMSFKSQFRIDATDDFLLDPSGSLIPITSNKLIILDDAITDSLYKIDVETLDTYFVSSSIAPVVVHNACFIAGTQITLSDWSTKNIEDVVVGDVVISFNEESEKQEDKEVLSLLSPLHDDLVKYTLSNGTVITSTFDHPYYVNGLELASYRPEWTNERYEALSGVIEIKVGDVVNLEANDESSVHIISIEEQPTEATQTYIFHVKDNMNFYANGILTHNKYLKPGCCFITGTEITLSNGDSKNIEDIIVGDEVIGWKDGERSNGSVIALKPTILGERKLHIINELKTRFTDEHPFLTEDGWKSIRPEDGTEYGILKVGDKINLNEEWVEIQTLSEIEGEGYDQPVYNFTVEDINSYIADGIIVHNK